MIPDDSGLFDTAARHFACFRPMWTGPRPHRICVGWTDALFRGGRPTGMSQCFVQATKQSRVTHPPLSIIFRDQLVRTARTRRRGEGRGAKSVVEGSGSWQRRGKRRRETNQRAEGVSGTGVRLVDCDR